MKNFFIVHQSSKGITLIEVMLTVAILTIAIVGALSLLSQVSNTAVRARNQFIAANLAQEGVELAYNIRTTNWIRNQFWLIGLSPGTFCSDFTTLPNSPPVLTPSASACPLYLNISNMYVLAAGTTTPFSRLITITGDGTNPTDVDGIPYLDVQSRVTWDGGTHSITAEDRFYNWK